MSGGERSLKVVIADDNVVVARCLAFLLRRDGHECRIAVDGEAALQAVAETKPDLLVLDLEMPKMSGSAVCRALRADPAFASTHVLVLTGQGGRPRTEWEREIGADALMLKPLDPRALLDYVHQHLFGGNDDDEPGGDDAGQPESSERDRLVGGARTAI